MVVLNFGSPLYPAHVRRIQRLAGTPVRQVIDIDARAIRDDEPLPQQVVALVDEAGLTPEEWAATSWVVHLPPNGAVAGALLVELYRRLGRFPALLRVLPYGGVEIVDLADIGAPVLRSA
jgi:hypothetical protein